MSSNVLFFTSVIGGGHVFRDLAIGNVMNELEPEWDITFVSGGNAYKMLEAEGVPCEEISGLEFPAHLGTASFLKLYFIVLYSEMRQLWELRGLVKKYDPKLIVLDEYFFLADYCRLKGIPVVFLSDFVGVPQVSFFRNPLRASLEAFFDWLVAWWLPKRVQRWIFIGDQIHIPREEWRRRATERGIVSVEPITKVQYTPPASREEARKKLGMEDDEVVVTVAVGCSGVGSYLLEAAGDAATILRETHPKLRMELMCGIGIDPEPIEKYVGDAANVHGYVRNLEEFFAASDVVVAQCGLTTTTEALMIGVPTIVVPLANHWEQENTARYMQEKAKYTRIGADKITPERLVEAITELLESREGPPDDIYEGNGHVEAAKLIVEVRAA